MRHEAIGITWRDLRLAAQVFAPPMAPATASGLPAVLFIHGWSGFQDANDVVLAARLAQAGFICLSFDLAGHGLSAGDPQHFTAAQFLSQALAAYDALAQLPEADRGRISVCGSSLGAYLAMLLGSERAPANLSLRVPANYPDEIFDRTAVGTYVTSALARPWRSIALPPTGTRSLQALSGYRGHVQIIEAAHDEVIPHQTIANYLNAAGHAASLSHVLLADATHVIYEHPVARLEAFRAVQDWLQQHRNDRQA